LELESRVLVGFKQWKERHGERIKGERNDMLAKGGVVGTWEKDVQKLSSVSLVLREGLELSPGS
jgi:hypothetical protein